MTTVQTPAEPIIRFESVEFARKRLLLDSIDWTVHPGEHWVIMGRNGAGKSLLLNILAGYLWPTKGSVRVLYHRYGAVDLRELRKKMGWVSAFLAEKMPKKEIVRDIVISGHFASLGLYRDIPPEIQSKSEHLITQMGLETVANQPFGSLSMGEKQRCLLARALMSNPELLILDEPCSGLDLAAREKFLTRLKDMAGQPDSPTMIMVTHRISEIVPGFTHALLLHHGSRAAAGSLEEVLTGEQLSRVMEIPVEIIKSNGRWQYGCY